MHGVVGESGEVLSSDDPALNTIIEEEREKYDKIRQTCDELYQNPLWASDIMSVGIKHGKTPTEMAYAYSGELLVKENGENLTLKLLEPLTMLPLHEVLSVFFDMEGEDENEKRETLPKGLELWNELRKWKNGTIASDKQFSLLHLSSHVAEMMELDIPEDMDEITSILKNRQKQDAIIDIKLVEALTDSILKILETNPTLESDRLKKACDVVIPFLRFDTAQDREDARNFNRYSPPERDTAKDFFLQCKGALLASDVALHVAKSFVATANSLFDISFKPGIAFIDFFHRLYLTIDKFHSQESVLKQRLYSTFVFMLLNDGILNRELWDIP